MLQMWSQMNINKDEWLSWHDIVILRSAYVVNNWITLRFLNRTWLSIAQSEN